MVDPYRLLRGIVIFAKLCRKLYEYYSFFSGALRLSQEGRFHAMNRSTIDTSLKIKELVTPRQIREQLPITAAAEATVLQTRQAIRDILYGRDQHRLLVVIGPCSIHDSEAAHAYGSALKKVGEATKEHLLIVMRTYFEKPRTTVGWKGLINDPHLDGSCDIAEGLRQARTLLLNLNNLGVPCATESLDPVTPQYLSDLISWSAIGARTTESQTHREMASGLSMPVGFKNGTGWQSASRPQCHGGSETASQVRRD